MGGPPGRCLRFEYGGCAGNANNFLSMADCEAECGGGKDERKSDPCREPVDRGEECEGQSLRKSRFTYKIGVATFYRYKEMS